jgi:hypothetical protein
MSRGRFILVALTVAIAIVVVAAACPDCRTAARHFLRQAFRAAF